MEVQYEIVISNGFHQNEYQFGMHTSIFSLLEGKASLIFEHEDVELRKGELYAMNFGKLYSISASSDAVIAELKINYEDVMKSSGKKNLKFYCDTLNDVTRNHYSIKKVFSKLLRLHVMGGRQYEEISIFYHFLSILMNEYIRDSIEDHQILEDDDMYKARLYLHTHYSEKITLEDICNKFYFSVSTFTRNFKKQTNQSMIQYLNSIRIKEAKRLLLEKDISVTDIALEVGFSDVASFTKTFKKVTGISPLKFKQKISSKGVQNLENQELIKMVEKTFLEESEETSADGVRKIYHKNAVNTQNTIPYNKSWTNAIGIQKAKDLLSPQYQQHLLRMKEELRFQYIRIPLILSEEIVKIKEGKEYDFQNVDLLLDFILEHKMIPILELSGRQKKVVSHALMIGIEESSYYTYYESEFIKLVSSFISHVFYRYAGYEHRLENWIWEIQYERNQYPLERFVSNFHEFSNQVRKWSVNHRFGGYGIDLFDWEEKEIEQLSNLSFKADYISVNVYPYRCTIKQENVHYMERLTDSFYLQTEMKKLRNTLDAYGFSNVPIYVTQWNTSLEDFNVINDSYVKATWMMVMTSCLSGMAEFFIYDTAIDIKNSENVLYGGKGLLSKDGLEKSIYNTMVGLSKFGSKLQLCSDNLVFSYLKPNHYVGICFNRKNFSMSYYQNAEVSIKKEDIPYFFDDQDILKQEIKIPALIDGVYRIRLTIINEERSVLTRLRKMCNQTYLGAEDIQFLKSQNPYDIQILEKRIHNESLKFTVTIKPNELVIIQVFPVELSYL